MQRGGYIYYCRAASGSSMTKAKTRRGLNSVLCGTLEFKSYPHILYISNFIAGRSVSDRDFCTRQVSTFDRHFKILSKFISLSVRTLTFSMFYQDALTSHFIFNYLYLFASFRLQKTQIRAKRLNPKHFSLKFLVRETSNIHC